MQQWLKCHILSERLTAVMVSKEDIPKRYIDPSLATLRRRDSKYSLDTKR